MSRLTGLMFSVSAVLALALACGSGDEEKGDGEGAGGTGAAGTGVGGLNLETDSGPIGPNQDGGSVPLTPQQVEEIQNGACAGWAGEGELLPAVLQLVVDVSGSMEEQAPGSRQSKWRITHDALVEAMTALGSDTAVGILTYPNIEGGNTGRSSQPRDRTECVNVEERVDVGLLGAPSSDQRAAISAALNRASTGGGTPTHDAYDEALKRGLIPYETQLPKFMLLITDGQPTYSLSCVGTGRAEDAVPARPIINQIRSARENQDIKTFVIGSPGSEEAVETGVDMRPWLSEAAEVGGTGTPGCQIDGPNFCHLDMTEAPDFSAALRQGLAAIIGQIGQCTYALPTPPEGQDLDLTRVNLLLHGADGAKLVLPDGNGDCSEGWRFNEKQQVVLCERTCNEVKSDATARVELLFGCVSGEIPTIE